MHPCARGAGSALGLTAKREGARRTTEKRQPTRPKESEAPVAATTRPVARRPG